MIEGVYFGIGDSDPIHERGFTGFESLLNQFIQGSRD